MSLPRLTTAVLVLAGGALLTGCGSATDGPVADRAAHFYSAINDHDAAGACADLAPEARKSLEEQEKKKCEDAILDQKLPHVSGAGKTRVYGSMAQVAHRGEVAFLSRYDHRWLLTGVGCTKAGAGQPYNCTIEVG